MNTTTTRQELTTMLHDFEVGRDETIGYLRTVDNSKDRYRLRSDLRDIRREIKDINQRLSNLDD